MKTSLIQPHPTESTKISHRRAAVAYRDQLARFFPPPKGAALKVSLSPSPKISIEWDETDPAQDVWAFVVEDGLPEWDRIALSELAMAGLISPRELA